MSLAETFERVRSGVFHILFARMEGSEAQVIASGSGFKMNNCLVTNSHVFDGPSDTIVIIRKFDSSKVDIDEAICIIDYSIWRNHVDYGGCFISGSPKDQYDFAILDIPELKNSAFHSFSKYNSRSLKVGDEVALLGYPFDKFDLMCHKGTVSCLEERRLSNSSMTMSVTNLDATVNVNNSGGPLIDIETGEVYGIVTRKATGLSKSFDELEDVIRQNISILSPNPSSVSLTNGINTIAALQAGQSSLLKLVSEIRRSANVGIGYAFPIDYVAKDIEAFEGP